MLAKLTALMLTCLVAGALWSCGKPGGPQSGSGANSGTETTVAGRPASEKLRVAGKKAEQAGKGNGGNPKAEKKGEAIDPNTQAVSIPAIEAAQEKIDLNRLPESMKICTVNGRTLTVGDYRRTFKWQQLQLQSAVQQNPAVRAQALEQAKEKKITLSAAEKAAVLRVARKEKGSEDEFGRFLKTRRLSELEFNKQVLELALALKVSNLFLEQNLLNDMVNQELLCAAAESAGFGKKAMQRYAEIKRSPQYKQILSVSGLTASQLHQELCRAELMRLMAEKIQATTPVSAAQARQYYQANKAKFKHGERVRISQVIVGAPKADVGPIQSVRTQVKKANPKLAPAELDAAVALTINHQRQKAEQILARAKKGEDFAKLANEFTDDILAQAAKNGGDMGWHEKKDLQSEFADAVWTLKAGNVLPRLVESPLGFHVIKVTGHEGPGIKGFAEVEDALKAILTAAENQDAVNAWVRERRKTAQVALAVKFARLLSDPLSAR